MFNSNLKKEILAVVDNQIKENNPPLYKKDISKTSGTGMLQARSKRDDSISFIRRTI
jgi:hypothetical protein